MIKNVSPQRTLHERLSRLYFNNMEGAQRKYLACFYAAGATIFSNLCTPSSLLKLNVLKRSWSDLYVLGNCLLHYSTYRCPALICGKAILLWFLWCTIASAGIKQNTVEQYLSEAKQSGLKPNSLISQSSPYLLQHAYNPVQWYAWGEKAFKKARKENKPIFLSIGYSTCHWCHVMAHESFENKKVAEILNKHFISIKVDREERPDVDKVYMAATQLINGHGGWPMTVFLNNQLEPFHAGTYYPRDSAEGRRGLIELLNVINKLWVNERLKVDLTAQIITKKIIAEENITNSEVPFDVDIHNTIFAQFRGSFDTEFGGFGNAPKFPRPGLFSYLTTVIDQDEPTSTTQAVEAKFMLKKTLNEMAYGGMYDQIGGGFHRYSVDAQWQVPHFEKMLYSQALMTSVYVNMYKVNPTPLYKSVIEKTLDFVATEMTHSHGGFYSALDADSVNPDKLNGRKSEGAYYLWSETELKKWLTADEWSLIRPYFNILNEGNIDSDPQNEFGRKNILYVSEEYKNHQLTKAQIKQLNMAFSKLNRVREKRPRPHLDDKVITAWNGMMISALAKASTVMNRVKYLKAANKAATFIQENLLDKNNLTLNRSIRSGKASLNSGLSDYVWYIRGLIDLYNASNNKHWLSLAIKLQNKQNQLFYDKDNAAYFDFIDNDSTLLFRTKNVFDGALPAVNAVAIGNLADLFQITQDRDLELKAQMSLRLFANTANSNPAACASLLAISLKYAALLSK